MNNQTESLTVRHLEEIAQEFHLAVESVLRILKSRGDFPAVSSYSPEAARLRVKCFGPLPERPEADQERFTFMECHCPCVNGRQVHGPDCDYWEPLPLQEWARRNALEIRVTTI